MNDELQLIGGFKTEPRGLIDVKVNRFPYAAVGCDTGTVFCWLACNLFLFAFCFLGERNDGDVLAGMPRCPCGKLSGWHPLVRRHAASLSQQNSPEGISGAADSGKDKLAFVQNARNWRWKSFETIPRSVEIYFQTRKVKTKVLCTWQMPIERDRFNSNKIFLWFSLIFFFMCLSLKFSSLHSGRTSVRVETLILNNSKPSCRRYSFYQINKFSTFSRHCNFLWTGKTWDAFFAIALKLIYFSNCWHLSERCGLDSKWVQTKSGR